VIELDCFAEFELGTPGEGLCYWYEMPARPGSEAAEAQERERRRVEREIADSPEAKRIAEHFRELAGEVDFGPTH
jgi:hypothetical protein